jgi:glycosyltransferase involved in cell wall biosynthesis
MTRPWPITISLPVGLTVGGVTTWAVQLAEGLAAAGRETRLVVHAAARGYEELVDLVHTNTGKHSLHLVRAPDLKDPLEWNACLRAYRELLPTLLLPNLWGESFAIAAALATVHPDALHVVAWDHSDFPYEYALLSYYEPIIQRFVVMSRRCEAELRRRMPARTADVVYLRCGVVVPDETPRRPLSGRAIRLAYGGRIAQADKRVFDVARLAEELDRRGVHFTLRVVGDGPQAGELRARIAEVVKRLSDPRNSVQLQPPVPPRDMQAIWSWADVSLSFSEREGFCLSTMESMARGCVPVFTQVASGAGDLVQESVNGLTFPVGDVRAAASHIETLARSEAAWRAMSRAARDTADKQCVYNHFLAGVLTTLDAATGEAPRSWPLARSLLQATGDAVCSSALPSDAAVRLRRLLRHIAGIDGGPIAIYGAGNHTRALAPVWASSPVEIAAVLDDDYSLAGQRLWGWPIVTPEAAARTRARSVVLSSWLHEAEMWNRQHASLETAGLKVWCLYNSGHAGVF